MAETLWRAVTVPCSRSLSARCFGAGSPASSDRAWGPLPAQLRQLEMQLEQEYEEKQTVLHEKQDLEGLVGTLCEQVRTRPGCCFRQSQAKQN